MSRSRGVITVMLPCLIRAVLANN
ncbi:unnamed protein product, partial [Lasius platythorax]